MSDIEIVESFYKAFQQKNAQAMNAVLAENVCFEDPAFGKLKGEDVKYMWQFLTENAENFSLEYKVSEVKKNKLTAQWTSKYTFSATGNEVINEVASVFELKDGKIVSHKDDFDLKKWVKQALGSAAGIFGGSFLVKNAVQKQSNNYLRKYKKKNTLK